MPGTNQTPVIPDIIIPSEQLPPNEFILTEPAVLSKPGSYILGDDIIDFSETILTITGSDINIDGNGHSISGISIRFWNRNQSYKQGYSFGLLKTNRFQIFQSEI